MYKKIKRMTTAFQMTKSWFAFLRLNGKIMSTHLALGISDFLGTVPLGL